MPGYEEITSILAIFFQFDFLCLWSSPTICPGHSAGLAGRPVAQESVCAEPAGKVVFVPEEQVESAVQATLTALAPAPAPTPAPSLTPTPGPTATPVPSATPTQPPTPIPEKVVLQGIPHEYEKMNNCGPATLSMNLAYWGWEGDQLVTRAYLRPNTAVDDKNVMPAELANYVNTQTGLKALVRVGGDIDLLKRLIAAGFPVIVEKGFQPGKEAWMGHYALVSA
jgi:hypothetical protein